MSEPNYPPPSPPYGAPPAPPGSGTASPNRTIMIILSYLGIFALIPLLVEKDDREVQWHAKHGLVLLVAEVILWVALWIAIIVLSHVPGLGCIAMLGMPVLGLGIFILHIMAIVKGVNGQRLMVPGISEYANKF